MRSEPCRGENNDEGACVAIRAYHPAEVGPRHNGFVLSEGVRAELARLEEDVHSLVASLVAHARAKVSSKRLCQPYCHSSIM